MVIGDQATAGYTRRTSFARAFGFLSDVGTHNISLSAPSPFLCDLRLSIQVNYLQVRIRFYTQLSGCQVILGERRFFMHRPFRLGVLPRRKASFDRPHSRIISLLIKRSLSARGRRRHIHNFQFHSFRNFNVFIPEPIIYLLAVDTWLLCDSRLVQFFLNYLRAMRNTIPVRRLSHLTRMHLSLSYK